MPNALTRYTSSRNSPAKCVAFHLGREAGKQRPFHFHHGGAKQQPAWHGKPSVAVPCYVTPCGLAAALAGSSSDAPRGHGLLGCHRHLPQCRSALLLDRPVPGFVGSVRSSPELSGPGNARAVAAGRHFGSLAGSRCLVHSSPARQRLHPILVAKSQNRIWRVVVREATNQTRRRAARRLGRLSTN
jgi:hypothetical protein